MLPAPDRWPSGPGKTPERASPATNTNGIIRLQGAMWAGSTSTAFVLPADMRPMTFTYVTADLCSAKKGRISISPLGGGVSVQTGEGTFEETPSASRRSTASPSLGR